MSQVKPNFLICGTMKGGTTWLYKLVDMHPQIYTPRSKIKEIHFFDINYKKGLDWYLKFFAEAKYNNYKAIGEKTPSYMYLEEIPERIHSMFPDMKLIFILRNPVDRAYSHYWHAVTKWVVEYLPFEQALELEKERISIDTWHKIHYSYLDRGKYIEQLERFEKYFSKDQMLVIILEELVRDPETNLRRVLEFLEVESGQNILEYYKKSGALKAPVNKGKSPRSYFLNKVGIKIAQLVGINKPPGSAIRYLLKRINMKEGYPEMKPTTRARLLKYYSEYNKRLAKHLGKDLIEWNK
ncbi:MAG: sulfotransferase domain-containing protein [Desulfurococcales archaeon]|nr:sulfotransferase domain-containing protein [Desulfurococcales archaeon]